MSRSPMQKGRPMPWPAVDSFRLWVGKRKELLKGLLGIAIEGTTQCIPGVGLAGKIVSELAKYGRSAPKLVSVKPGITGLWQVSGRQETSYERRVELDMQYIDRWSVAGDLRIVLRTFGVVLSGRGAH